MAGAAAMVYGMYDLYSQEKGATAEGAKQGGLIKQGLASNDPRKQWSAAQALLRAQTQGSGAAAATAYMDQGTRYLNYATGNVGGIAAQQATDKATEAATGKSQHQRALETLKARELIDTADVKKEIGQAIREGILSGSRSFPMSHPARGGTQ
jgi:hypothetical protein